MAIRSKGSLIGNKNTANTSTNVSEVLTNTSTNNSNSPEELVEIPENNPEHESSPEGFHTTMPGWTLWSSFEEAKDAANLVYLKRGEAHTEFYKENDEYHCVVAIGNIVPNSGHLFLTDSGSEYSIDDRLDQMNSSIFDLGQYVTYYTKIINKLNSSINEFEHSVANVLQEILQNISNFEKDVNENIVNQNILINNVSTFVSEISEITSNQIENISTYVSEFDSRITINENNIVIINSSISDIKSQLEASNASINAINNNIFEINSSINDIKTRLDENDNNIDNINSNLEQSNASINSLQDIANEQYEFIEDLQDDVFDINASIRSIKASFNAYVRETDNLLIDIDSSIEDINCQLNKQNNKISDINSSISRLNTSVNILEDLQQNTSTRLSEIDITLVDTNKSIHNINSSIYNIVLTLNQYDENIDIINSNITQLENRVLGHDKDIIDINNKISSINSSISYITNDINTINNDIINVKDAIEAERLRNNNQDYSIETLNSSVNWILETMSCKCALIEEEIKRNNIQDISINLLTQAINDLQDQINEFQPIEDASIYPLFHDDIYTINLCCYTKSGYIEINDHIAGTDIPGGRSRRVAECTPFNEYKTYVHGDTVDFIAHNNPGYKFVCWYVNGNIDQPIYNQPISYTFGDDINVIGSLLDGIEPDMLTNGYTAKFKKLHQLKVSINQITNDPNAVVQYFNDTLEIYITEPNQIRQKINIEDALAGNVYYDDGSKIQVIAKPDADASHSFTKYIISDGIHTPEEYINATYTNFNITTDLIIDSYFMEYWIIVSGAETPQYAGRIFINGNQKQIAPDNTTYYLGDSEVTISANSNSGYGFNKWSTNSNKPSLTQFKHDINPYRVTDNLIKLKVNKNVAEYELVAYFDSGVNTHYAEFYTDDSYSQLFIRTQYNDDDIVYSPENIPTKPGYTFVEWQCEDNTFILGESEIFNDLRFYAIWQVNTYDVSFYSKGILYEELQNIDYNTPFSTLGVYQPDNISTGETFMGWMVDSYVINPSTYHIQGYTTFDASIVLNTYNVAFIVNGDIIQNSSVEYNTLLSEIKPNNPEIDGYVFKWWSLNNESVDDNYQIQHDTSFIAIFNNE